MGQTPVSVGLLRIQYWLGSPDVTLKEPPRDTNITNKTTLLLPAHNRSFSIGNIELETELRDGHQPSHLFLIFFASASQFHVYHLVVADLNKEKVLVRTFSVIVKLQALIGKQHNADRNARLSIGGKCQCNAMLG